MGTLNDDFSLETTVDLDNIDEKAAQGLLRRAEAADKVEVAEETKLPVEKAAKDEDDVNGLEPTAEELEAYSEKVRKRIDKLTQARREEERERLRIQAERDQAVELAQQALLRAQALEKRANELATLNQDTTLTKVEADIAAARKELTEATNSYDTEAMVEANLKLADLVAQKRELLAKKASTPVAREESSVVQQQPSTRPAPDARAQEWVARNSAWFQKDKAMTAFAFGVHEELVASGVDPRADADKYYSQLDQQIKARFPEKFEQATRQTSTPRTSPVAPVSRSSTGKTKVTLSATEMSLARRLGVTPEQFAAEKVKLMENRNA